jgi:hypothetical protein
MGAIQSIARFFSSIGEIITDIICVLRTLAYLVTHPIDLLKAVLVGIIGIVLYILLKIWYTIYSIKFFNQIVFFWFYLFTVAIFDIVLAIFWLAYFAVMFCISVILWTADLLTLGLVRFLTRCENELTDWYTRPNFAFGNTSNRFVIAQLPCSNRFKPTGPLGFICKKQQPFEPGMCPQSQIFRIYKGIGLTRPEIMPDTISPTLGHYMSNPSQKDAEVRKFFQIRQKFLNKCHDSLSSYKNIIRSVCSNFETIALENEQDRKKLPPLCYQVFCEGTGNNESFCPRLKEDNKLVESDCSIGEYINMILYVTIAMLIGIVILLMYTYGSHAKKKMKLGSS